MTRFVEQISDLRKVDGTITAQVQVPADAVWFDGHFPGNAILPGVAQLAAVVQVISKALDRPVGVTHVSRVRFKQAILPSECIDVQITPKEDSLLSCGFRLLKGPELVCSGFLKLCEME